MKQLYHISSYTLACLLLLALFVPVKGSATDIVVRDTVPQIDSINQSVTADTTSIQSTTSNPKTDKASKKEKTARVKPTTLETYVFTDSALRAKRIFMWKADPYFNNITVARIDTLSNDNKTELPFYKNDVGVTYLGVTGSATLTHNYFNHKQTGIFSFFNPYADYIHTPETTKFYNTKTPYTELGYYTSGSKRVSEDNLRVLFTANLLPMWNFGLFFQKFGAKGTYQNQKTSSKSLTLFTSYTGKRYVAHAGYVYNGITNNENGGIIDDFFFADTVIDAGAIDVNLKTAKNKLRSNAFFLTHSYGVPIEALNKRRDSTGSNTTDGGTMIFFGHAFNYTRYNRVYTDGPDDLANNYYNKFYLSPISSRDTSSASLLDNKLYIKLQPWSSSFWISNIDGGIGYRFENYYAFNPNDYLYKHSNDGFSTAYVYGGASGVFKKYFQWNAFLNYHLTGYQQNDLLFDVTAKASIYPLTNGVHLQGRFTFDNRRPSYFNNHYFSNHAKWDNDFEKTQETKIQLSLSIPDWDLEAGFNNALVNKPVYYGLDGLPTQSSDVINITSAYLQKNFKVWLLHFDHRLLMQLTSDKDVIPLPLFSGNITYYIQWDWVKNVLNSQIGFDAYYNTNFYDYAYNPAVGMFHTQAEKQLGNYPWIDVFANFKWKHANVYVKFTNAGEGIIGERNYFSALHYPRNNRMFRIGIRWMFFT